MGFEALRSYTDLWIKEDPLLVEHLLIIGFSSFTNNPLNLMVRGPTSTGKSWSIKRTMEIFPNATILSNATPKSFFYQSGELVDKDGRSIRGALEQFEYDIAAAQNNAEKSRLKRLRSELLAGCRVLLDFRNKIFVVMESIDAGLWETLRAALSHDSFEMEYRTVVEGRSRTVLIRGWPTVVYATAANEEKRFAWAQIKNRFVITTANESAEKYFAANQLTSDLYGLPFQVLARLYPDRLKREAQAEVQKILTRISTLRGEARDGLGIETDNVVLNLFKWWLDEKFPARAGEDMRSYRYFCQYIGVSALVDSDQRPRLLVDGKVAAVVACWQDVERALKLVGKELSPISADKVNWFNKWVLPVWNSHLRQPNSAQASLEAKNEDHDPFSVSDIVDYARSLGTSLGRDSIRDVYLALFVDIGVLQEANPDRRGTQAVEYLVRLDPAAILQLLSGFVITTKPEPETVNQAISRLKAALADEQGLTFETPSKEFLEGNGLTMAVLSPQVSNAPYSANGTESASETPSGTRSTDTAILVRQSQELPPDPTPRLLWSCSKGGGPWGSERIAKDHAKLLGEGHSIERRSKS